MFHWLQGSQAKAMKQRGSIAFWKKQLSSQSWNLKANPPPWLENLASFAAARDGVNIAVLCSGADLPFRATQIRDLLARVTGKGLIAVFACGEITINSAIKHLAEERGGILLERSQSEELGDKIRSLPAKVVGVVEVVNKKGFVSGWAKLLTGDEWLRVDAEVGSGIIGTSIANRFRKDLSRFGSGQYEFVIPINFDQTSYEMTCSRLLVRCYRKDTSVGVLVCGSTTMCC